ncbi:MAG TPA: ATP-binding protein [Gemmatimonadaceae bacterium]|jgi:two-component system chemotaxis sensor kinase CheA
MSTNGAGVPSFELTELALRIAELPSNNADSLRELRPTLHRAVVSPAVSGAVKTFIVQALLLLDDPRLDATTPTGPGSHGAPLVAKIRKLLDSALAAHATAMPTPAAGVSSRAEFSPDALLSPETEPSLVEEFTIEAREQLAIAESALLVLDTDGDDLQAVDTMFRALHTIKGTSAFLGVEHVTELAHHAESLLSRVRAGTARCDGPVSSLLFRSIDMLDAILVAIESVNDGEVAMLPDGFRELLTVLRKDQDFSSTSTPAPPRVSGSMRRLRLADGGVRVRASDLDRLTDIVRELVLTHSMLARDNSLRGGANAELARKLAHAESIVEELDSVTNELRTVPFANTLQRVVRLARDVANQSNKSIEIITDGETVMIERSTADAIGEALLHMVRNAVDHGVEPAEQREKAGKPARGRIRVSAQHLGSNLVVEMTDDGIGLDARALVRHAVERGILSDGIELSEQEAFSLILRPGFTTAQVVTGISGRGVGMDVVRSNVEALGGTIDIASRVGAGTAFTIRLPFRAHAARNVDTWGEPQRTIGLIA